MSEVEIIQGDANYLLTFTVYDADDNLVDLTGASTISLKYKKYGEDSVESIIGSIQGSPLLGVCQFNISSKFSAVASIGEYKAEIEIVYSSGQIITAPDIVIKVYSDL